MMCPEIGQRAVTPYDSLPSCPICWATVLTDIAGNVLLHYAQEDRPQEVVRINGRGEVISVLGPDD